MRYVVGLDLSLNGSAAVVSGADWNPADWSALDSVQFTPPKGATGAERLHHVSERIVAWVSSYGGCPHVYVEDYAYAATVTNARAVAELVGCVKRDLWREGVEVVPVAMNSARETLLGKVPSKKTSGIDVKDFVNHALARMGASFATLDQGDAFVVMNHGRAMLGLSYIGVGA